MHVSFSIDRLDLNTTVFKCNGVVLVILWYLVVWFFGVAHKHGYFIKKKLDQDTCDDEPRWSRRARGRPGGHGDIIRQPPRPPNQKTATVCVRKRYKIVCVLAAVQHCAAYETRAGVGVIATAGRTTDGTVARAQYARVS